MSANAQLATQLEYTIQSQTRRDVGHHGLSLGLLWMATSGQIVSPWWSKTRDAQLRAFAKGVDHVLGAFWMIGTKLSSVPFTIMPRDKSVKAHSRAAEFYNILLHENVEFAQAWDTFWFKFFLDLWSQDNGAFGEIVGDGAKDGPIKGPALGLSHLDSFRCERTSNPEYPVVYQDTDGHRYKLHYTRVIYKSQMPDTAAEMYGVGHCWLTRAINVAQNILDILVYKQEKLGSRPNRQILFGKGLDAFDIIDALKMAGEDMDSQGLSRYAKTSVLGSTDPDVDLSTIDLTSIPDGFDERNSIELAMYVIALAGGFPPRWLWPATTVGATKADAYYSHIAGTGGGAGWHINMMTTLIGGDPRGIVHSTGKFLPPYLKIEFDYQDDEKDQLRAKIHQTRAQTREVNLNIGATTVRVEREKMLAEGEISPQQFSEMELDDGRLPTGESVMILFVDPEFDKFLDLEVDDPLLVDMHDPLEVLLAIEKRVIHIQEEMILGNRTRKEKARQALAALCKLKDIYQQLLATAELQTETTEGEDEAEKTEEEETTEGEDEAEKAESPEAIAKAIDAAIYIAGVGGMEPDKALEHALKEFNFGANVGEIIRGRSACGDGGNLKVVRDGKC